MSSSSSCVLYVSGLDQSVRVEDLKALFSPFGELSSVNIPMDFNTNKSKGFAFIEFAIKEDALDALENLNLCEYYGRTLNIAITKNYSKLASQTAGGALWKSEDWVEGENIETEEN